MYRVYGLRPQERDVSFEEFLGMIHPDDQKRVQGIIYASFETAEPFDFEHRIILPNKIQRILHGMGRVVTDKYGAVLRMLGTAQDVTAQKQAELALQQSDQRFKTVTMATHDLVYDLDLKKETIWFNEALHQEYGYAKRHSDTTWQWWIENIHPDDAPQVRRQIRALQRNKQQTWQAEYRFKKADGSYALVRNRAFVLRGSGDQAERIIGSLLDITAQKQLEDAKDEFLSLVSHQLRTPLTAARLSSEILAGGLVGQLTAEQKDYANRITAASIRMIGLVGDILNVSRIELGRVKVEPVSTDVNRLIRAQLKETTPVAKVKRVALHFTAASKLPPVSIDAEVFNLMLENLLSNAIRYCPKESGRVRVSFNRTKDGSFMLAVSDNGIGIPATAREHIFNRFYRAENAVNFDAEGTGIGLYLIKLVCDTVGATIWFESSKNRGATFYIQLPSSGMKAAQGKLRLEQPH